MVTTCPVGHEDIATVNKCVYNTQFMPESYDDIVIVSDESTPRQVWPLGRVLKTNVGDDGLVG